MSRDFALQPLRCVPTIPSMPRARTVAVSLRHSPQSLPLASERCPSSLRPARGCSCGHPSEPRKPDDILLKAGPDRRRLTDPLFQQGLPFLRHPAKNFDGRVGRLLERGCGRTGNRSLQLGFVGGPKRPDLSTCVPWRVSTHRFTLNNPRTEFNASFTDKGGRAAGSNSALDQNTSFCRFHIAERATNRVSLNTFRDLSVAETCHGRFSFW
jgi:hypothetical protein